MSYSFHRQNEGIDAQCQNLSYLSIRDVEVADLIPQKMGVLDHKIRNTGLLQHVANRGLAGDSPIGLLIRKAWYIGIDTLTKNLGHGHTGTNNLGGNDKTSNFHL